MTTTVADVLADGLARAGTTRVFAVAGDRDSGPLVDAIERRGLPVVRVSRPDVACVMAAVAGTLGGAPGAAVIGGDLGGAAGGLAYASFNRAPTIVISGGTPVHTYGSDAMTKAELAVTSASAAHWIAHACQLAMKEPWGPVRLVVPTAAAVASTLPVATSCRPAPLPPPDPSALDTAVRLLEASERTLVVAGRWCRSESDAAWTRAFAEARPAPVLATPNARGVMPDPHPLLIGILDAGEPERTLLASADLIVAVGVDPGEAPQWPSGTRVLELTPVAPESPSDDRVAVIGEVGLILEELAPRLRDRRSAEWDVARLHALKQAAWAPPVTSRELAASRVVETARRLTPAGTMAVFERGEAWRHAARAWRAVASGECSISTEPSTEGFALVASAAAQLARPERQVVCFTDARVIRGAPAHLATIEALGVPVLVVVAGDAASPFTPPPTLRGFTATSIAEFGGAFETALGGGAPVILSVAGL
jgi:thiamine pyrophosphate-dependent acetolactate synthase large subunit-like protein